jgi:hypothetical protein
VPREAAASGKAILKKFSEEVLVFRKGYHAVAYVSGRENAVFTAQAAGAAAVIGDGDYRGEVGDGLAMFFFFR